MDLQFCLPARTWCAFLANDDARHPDGPMGHPVGVSGRLWPLAFGFQGNAPNAATSDGQSAEPGGSGHSLANNQAGGDFAIGPARWVVPYNAQGQNWGMQPFRPQGLLEWLVISGNFIDYHHFTGIGKDHQQQGAGYGKHDYCGNGRKINHET